MVSVPLVTKPDAFVPNDGVAYPDVVEYQIRYVEKLSRLKLSAVVVTAVNETVPKFYAPPAVAVRLAGAEVFEDAT